MKLKILITAGAFLLLTTTPGWTQTLKWETMVDDGVERGFGWYAGPEVGSAPAPVVLVLHGGGGSALQVWNGDDGRAWRRLADEHGLILLLPEGRSDLGARNRHHWNDCRNNILEPSAASDADDVGFLREVLLWATDRWPADLDRVYISGASNGGMMSFRVAMEASDLIAAAAPIIANTPDPSECRESTRAIPMLIMNGTDDPLMPWEGGCVANSGCGRGTVRSTDETVEYWTGINAITTGPVCTDLPDTDQWDGSTVTVCRWNGPAATNEVVLYRIDGGGHAVPGPDSLPLWYRLIAGRKNHDISAPDEIWAFFERHKRTAPAPRPSENRVGD